MTDFGLARGRELPGRTLGALLVIPLAVVTLIFLVGPIVFGIVMGFERINSRTLNGTWLFAGLSNWNAVFEDPEFAQSVPRTLILATGTVLIAVVGAMVMALVLQERFAGRGFIQVAVLLPWIVAPVAAGLMWRWLFDANFGFVNLAGQSLGLIDEKVPWLSDPNVAMGVTVFAESWRGIPLLALLFLARLNSINRAIYSAAKVDGADAWSRFWRVTVPSMRGVLGVGIVIQTISALQAFDVIFTLTQGGPSGATTVLNLLVYKKAFQNLNFGQAAVLAIIVAIITGLVIVLAAAVARVITAARKGRAS